MSASNQYIDIHLLRCNCILQNIIDKPVTPVITLLTGSTNLYTTVQQLVIASLLPDNALVQTGRVQHVP